MYIPVNEPAAKGEYIVHQKTGDIKEVFTVDEYGEVEVAVYFPVPKLVTWSLDDYFVLRKIADIYVFGSVFDNKDGMSIKFASCKPGK